MKLSYLDAESPAHREIILLAGKATELTKTFSIIQRILSRIITIVGFAAVIANMDGTIFAAILFVSALKVLFSFLRYSRNKKVRLLYAQNDREGNYLSRVAYFDAGGQKEIRVNNLENWFIAKNNQYREKMLTLQYKDFRYSALFDILMAIALALQTLLVLGLLTQRYLTGEISIADFTMYFSASTTLVSMFTILAGEVELYHQQVLNLGDFQKLLSLNTITPCEHCCVDADFENENNLTICFEDVSFAYPNAKVNTLNHINLRIGSREKLVIVGQNGAGKTTLIKLLCKFYKPTTGKITIGGEDIWQMSNEKYYKLIATVFQDFQNFAFSFAEAIALDDHTDHKKIENIAHDIGLKPLFDTSSDGVNTYITKNFSKDGIEPSGGESQKIAIARAIYKNAPILILDEPTASLDAKAEAEIYQNFFQMSGNKTTIFVSHRLAVSTIADHIAVFVDGTIAEYGNHKALMQKNGVYAEMYRKQSEGYIT
ncbi:MAG: ABC transporter ATP-binding protein [Clostridia bacterium]|nr:ABC transporter ATP-binding protein [Clostridia bacterium]